MRTLVNADVGFNNSDKGYGPVLYSRNLYVEQCIKHLYDEKGTYEPIHDSKEKILCDVVSKLKTLLSTYCNENSATQQLAKKLTEWAEHSLKKGMLCKFYVIWKLHKPANAQGVRTRPIYPNIGYPSTELQLSTQPVGRGCVYAPTRPERLTQLDSYAREHEPFARSRNFSDVC